MSTTQLPFERLKGRENYSQWKIGARAHMIIKGYWNNCLTQPATSANETLALDMKALGELTLLLDSVNYTHVDGKIMQKMHGTVRPRRLKIKALAVKWHFYSN